MVVLDQFISLIQPLHSSNRSAVPPDFPKRSDFSQGCPLPPVLFNFLIDMIARLGLVVLFPCGNGGLIFAKI